MCVCVPTWVSHRRVQQVHGGTAQPQAVDAVRRLFEVGHHATGAQGSTQLRPLQVRFAPMLLQLDGTRGARRWGSEPRHWNAQTHVWLIGGVKVAECLENVCVTWEIIATALNLKSN